MTDYLKEKEKYLDDTITVGKLIEVLNRYPKDMKVYVTWESTLNELKEKWVYESETGNLYIDGDYGFYKQDFAKYSDENE